MEAATGEAVEFDVDVAVEIFCVVVLVFLSFEDSAAIVSASGTSVSSILTVSSFLVEGFVFRCAFVLLVVFKSSESEAWRENYSY